MGAGRNLPDAGNNPADMTYMQSRAALLRFILPFFARPCRA
jgi:hypothetical protein